MQSGRFSFPFTATALVAFAIVLTVPCRGQSTSPYIYGDTTLADGTFMRDWLLCGPFDNAEDGGAPYRLDHACGGFFTDYLAPIGGETGCAPQPGLEVPAPDNTYLKWTAIAAHDDRVYFDDYLPPGESQTGYAVCWIDADKAEDRLFSIGSNDGIRIWVNGEEVLRYHDKRIMEPDANYIRLPLREGRNQILVKLANCEDRWGFMMRPVDNDHAMQEVINRLREVLRFDYKLTDSAFEVTFGNPLIIGNISELPTAQITLINGAGERIHTLEAALCHPVSLSFADFPEKEYTLEGKVLWPRRGRVLIPGILYRGDLQEEVQALTGAGPASLTSSRPASAYVDLVSSIAALDRENGFSGEPYAYRRLKEGLTHALEHALALQNSASPYERVFPPPRQFGTSGNQSVAVSGNWTLNIADSIFDASLDSVIARQWSELTGALANGVALQVHVFALETEFLDMPIPELEGTDAEFSELALEFKDFVPENREGYLLDLAPAGVTIVGRTAAGAYYGLDTFLQLLEQSPLTETNNRVLSAGRILDEPVYAVRAAYHQLESTDDAFEEVIDQFAALRYNTIFLPSSLYPDINDTEILPMLASAYAYCRARFIEPIPLIETFGDNTLAARIDPNLWEGVFVEELPIEVDNLRRLNLPFDRLLESAATQPRLRTGAGYKILRKDRDFVIESFSPPVIQLKGQAPVQTGETVLVSADLVDRSRAATRASCPSDSETWVITERVLQGIYEHLHPRGVHLGHTGAGYVNLDSRCLAREAPNAVILADAVQKGYDIVRKLDRKADIFIWGDHFNPMQRAIALDALKAPELLPKDITVLDWHYKSDSYYDVWRVEQGIRYFDQFGLDTMGVVRRNPLNVAQFAPMKRDYPRRFRGILFHPEDNGANGAHTAAQAGWQGSTLLGSIAP